MTRKVSFATLFTAVSLAIVIGVTAALSEERALELLEQGFVPDSILPDIAIPQMDGYAGFIRSLP